MFALDPPDLPMATAWSLTELAELKGHQDLYAKQTPERLKALREHALIESAVSSNRIEGVEIEPARAKAVVLGKARLRDRNEEEVRGYRSALAWIHKDAESIPFSADTFCKLHRLCRGDIWDAGRLKDKDGDIVETFADGTSRVRFRTVPAAQTPEALRRLSELWLDVLRTQRIPPLVLLAASNLDFLCIHPFRDGNGRVSRLLLLLQLYHLGYEAGRFISIERLIEQNKERYYETLQMSSQGWHEGKHDPWPYVNYLLFILKQVYKEFETRVGQMRAERGAKTALIQQAIQQQSGAFSLFSLETACPGVSRDMIRKVLLDLQKERQIRCIKRGRSATWERIE